METSATQQKEEENVGDQEWDPDQPVGAGVCLFSFSCYSKFMSIIHRRHGCRP